MTVGAESHHLTSDSHKTSKITEPATTEEQKEAKKLEDRCTNGMRLATEWRQRQPNKGLPKEPSKLFKPIPIIRSELKCEPRRLHLPPPSHAAGPSPHQSRLIPAQTTKRR